MKKNTSFLKPFENRLRLDRHQKSSLNVVKISENTVKPDEEKKENQDHTQKNSLTNLKSLKKDAEYRFCHLNVPEKIVNEVLGKTQENLRINISRVSINSEEKKKSFSIAKRRVTSIVPPSKQPLKIQLAPTQPDKTNLQQKKTQVEMCLENMLKELQKQMFLTLKQSFISISQDSFLQLIIQLIESISDVALKDENKKFTCIRSESMTIRQLVLSKSSQKVIGRMGLCKKVLTERIDPEQFSKQVNKISINIVTLQEQERRIETIVQALRSQKRELERVLSERQETMKSMIIESEKINNFVKTSNEQFVSLAKTVEQKETALKKVEEDSHKIAHFIENQQTWPMIKYVGEEYKKLQGEIFDYALYLQQDALFSTYNWEPKPFMAVEKLALQDLKNISQALVFDEESIEVKIEKMTSFLQENVGMFKRINDELRRMNNEKTTAIRHFVEMMQKWVQNFEIKEDTLVSLRKEFAFDAGQINSLLEGLLGDGLSPESREQLEGLKKHWGNVEENYKYGNSFY